MNPILQEEHQHLHKVQRLLTADLAALKIDIKNLEDEYSKQLKEASQTGRQDDAVDIITYANKVMEARDYTFKRNLVEQMQKQVQTPYFGRIDFVTYKNKTDFKIYIGKHSYLPPDQKHRISDWRAPISSLYYNYQEPTKGAKYEFIVPLKYEPWKKQHIIIEGDLNLRRNIEISDGEISGVYDNNLRVDLLSEAIGKKSGGLLEDIIKTIQTGQNEIIRANPDRVCIVQGTAGSGKTTVAIHRISYLFYTYPETIKEANTLFLSSSKVLVNYVAKTLPELEIYSLERSTLPEFLMKVLKDNQLVFSAKNFKHKRNRNLEKADARDILPVLNEYAQHYKENFLKDFSQKPYYRELDIDRRISRMRIRPLYYILKAIREALNERLEELSENFAKGNIIIERLTDETKAALGDVDKTISALEPIKVYQDFLNYLSNNKNINIPFTPDHIDIDELSLIYLLADKLVGLERTDYKQVVVDEAQDMSPLNYYALKTLSSANGFTMLGDLNQATEDTRGIKTWNDLHEIFGKSTIDYYEIKVSYRTTKQIIQFARKILENFKEIKHLPEPFRREGPEPAQKEFQSRQAILEQILEDIIEITKDPRPKSIGIIETDPNEIKSTIEFLEGHNRPYYLVGDDFEDFSQSGIYIIPATLVKGLEFDSVFVIDPNSVRYPMTIESVKRLFVFATRTINRLYIYSVGNRNKLLPDS